MAKFGGLFLCFLNAEYFGALIGPCWAVPPGKDAGAPSPTSVRPSERLRQLFGVEQKSKGSP